MRLNVELTKSFSAFTLQTNLCLEGQRIGIFGPSGSGKSTFGKLVAGLSRPDVGRITLNASTLFNSAAGIDLAADKRRVAVVFQHAHLFPHMNVRENLLFGWKRTPVEQRKFDLEEVGAALDISTLFERKVTRLSGGEKQRVALGRALLASPELLILDEPLSALDRDLKRQIIPYLRKTLRRFSIPYLYISHSLTEMRLLTDQVLEFSRGQVTAISTAEDMARQRMVDMIGYINHLQLSNPREVGSMLGYRWGREELLLTDPVAGEGLFALSSRDIMLFKQHPSALSARNLLRVRIERMAAQGGNVAVHLDCQGQKLICQVVREAALELDLQQGILLYAAIKASAFRRLI